MSRLLGYIGNDPERVRCVLHAGKPLLTVEPAGVDGWGIGFYQGGEVLLRRRPKPPDGPVDLYEMAGELKTDVIVGHVRAATVGVSKNENTHPFRFRHWLFAHHGTVNHFAELEPELLASVPDFLRRNIRGQTDSEHLFHLFLSFLHDAGKLDDPLIPTQVAARAMSQALALVDKLTRERGLDDSGLDAVVSNGRILVAVRHGAPMYFYKVNGVRDCPVCRDPSAAYEPERRSRPRGADHDHLKGVVVVAHAPGAGAPWEELPDRHLLTVSHELAVEVAAL